ncbi:glycosyl hydrolase family 9-domain-containing protein [Syncephalis plumigaleata]|nr:glycosyl hydrolase family 9-domain-containing protein [Syncephalis plumigaleata]
MQAIADTNEPKSKQNALSSAAANDDDNDANLYRTDLTRRSMRYVNAGNATETNSFIPSNKEGVFPFNKLFDIINNLFKWPYWYMEQQPVTNQAKLEIHNTSTSINNDTQTKRVIGAIDNDINANVNANAKVVPLHPINSQLGRQTSQRPHGAGEIISLPNATDSYARHLGLAILFYEAQRSGKLPANQRIRWRKSAHLNDGASIGRDLSGGYYDAGDFIKFGLPGAYTASLLGWAAVDYASGLRNANEWHNNLAAIRWATDYFIKCHVKPDEFVVQVGDPKVDHKYWGSPEDMPSNYPRPVYVVSPKYPGSEPTAETAAAMAAAAIAFADTDQDYSTTLIKHAEQLYRLATQYTGLYQQSIARQAQRGMDGVKDCYESSGYYDELAWAAVWLYRATKRSSYLVDSEAYFARALRKSGDLRNSFLSWDDKAPAVVMLLARFTGKKQYARLAQRYTQWARYESTRTPGGLLWIKGGSEWGSTSVAIATAFLCAYYDDYVVGRHNKHSRLEKMVRITKPATRGIHLETNHAVKNTTMNDIDLDQTMAVRRGVSFRKSSSLPNASNNGDTTVKDKHSKRPTVMYLSRLQLGEKFIKQQVDYILGSNPAKRSYIVGADHTSPQRVHHAAAQGVPKYQGWRSYTSTIPNRHVLYGALVGGPDKHDRFFDRRDDYRHNEPALDYNAPLVMLLARMNAIKHHGISH